MDECDCESRARSEVVNSFCDSLRRVSGQKHESDAQVVAKQAVGGGPMGPVAGPQVVHLGVWC